MCYGHCLWGQSIFFSLVHKMSFFCCAVVHECKARLTAAGFKELKETQQWSVQPLDKVSSAMPHVGLYLPCCVILCLNKVR